MEEFWYRVTLTATEIEDPATTFPSGETEDYLYSSDVALTVARGGGLAVPALAPLPTEPEFVCGGGIMSHGKLEFTFNIFQAFTTERRGFKVTEASVEIGEVEPPGSEKAPRIEVIPVEPPKSEKSPFLRELPLRLEHPEDGPPRIVGPYVIPVRITGNFKRGENFPEKAFDQVATCTYYVDHAGLIVGTWSFGNDGWFEGSPFGLSGERASPEALRSDVFYIIKPHGEKTIQQPFVRAHRSGRYVPGTLRMFTEVSPGILEEVTRKPDGSEREILFENGVSVRLHQNGRHLIIRTTEDGPPRVEQLFFAISGTNKAKESITDFYRVFIDHCASGEEAGGLFKPAFNEDDDVCPLPPDGVSATGPIIEDGFSDSAAQYSADCGVLVFVPPLVPNPFNFGTWVWTYQDKRIPETDTEVQAAESDEHVVFPVIITDDGSQVTYTGPLQVPTKGTLMAHFVVVGPDGQPAQGEFFATLGDPPSDSRATHANGNLDPEGKIWLQPLGVMWPAGETKLLFSFDGKVYEITKITVEEEEEPQSEKKGCPGASFVINGVSYQETLTDLLQGAIVAPTVSKAPTDIELTNGQQDPREVVAFVPVVDSPEPEEPQTEPESSFTQPSDTTPGETFAPEPLVPLDELRSLALLCLCGFGGLGLAGAALFIGRRQREQPVGDQPEPVPENIGALDIEDCRKLVKLTRFLKETNFWKQRNRLYMTTNNSIRVILILNTGP